MKPRIVILSAFLSPFRSGAEACAEEVPRVLKNDYDFTIITARLRKDLPAEETWEGNMKIVRVGTGNFFWDKWLYPARAAREAAKHSPDIIHAVLETFAGYALMRCKQTCPNAKRILTCQTTNRNFLKGPIVRSADKVTVISSVLKKQCEELGRNDAIIIQNGLRTQDIPKTEKVPGRIVFVGRLEKMKGVDVLLEAIRKLKMENGELKIDVRIVGDGSQRQSLEMLAQKLGIADRVTFVGYVPMPEVYKEFAEAEIFCGLSRSEALGNVFLEAQAAGCAVVATNVGGIPDIVKDGYTGLLVEPDDPKAAADAIERLLTGSSLMQKLSHEGREHARIFDWYQIAQRYEAVYEGRLP